MGVTSRPDGGAPLAAGAPGASPANPGRGDTPLAPAGAGHEALLTGATGELADKGAPPSATGRDLTPIPRLLFSTHI